MADADFAGGRVRLCVRGERAQIWGSLNPPDVRVFDRERVQALTRGHRHVFEVEGRIYSFRAKILHDDRKPLDRFLASQISYSRKELGVSGRGRAAVPRSGEALGLMAPAVFALAYMRAGGPFRGRAALRYAHERMLYETLLALRLFEGDAFQWRSGSNLRQVRRGRAWE